MNANEIDANDIRESVSRLRYELQAYKDNASKGGSERRRNMLLLRWDIRKLERRLTQYETNPKSHGGGYRHTCRRAALLVHRNRIYVDVLLCWNTYVINPSNINNHADNQSIEHTPQYRQCQNRRNVAKHNQGRTQSNCDYHRA